MVFVILAGLVRQEHASKISNQQPRYAELPLAIATNLSTVTQKANVPKMNQKTTVHHVVPPSMMSVKARAHVKVGSARRYSFLQKPFVVQLLGLVMLLNIVPAYLLDVTKIRTSPTVLHVEQTKTSHCVSSPITVWKENVLKSLLLKPLNVVQLMEIVQNHPSATEKLPVFVLKTHTRMMEHRVAPQSMIFAKTKVSALLESV